MRGEQTASCSDWSCHACIHDVVHRHFRAHARLRLKLWEIRGKGWRIPSTHSFWSTGIGTSAAAAAGAADYRDGPSQRFAAIAALGAGRERRAKISTKE